MSGYRGAGFAGLIGTLLILFSLISAAWGLNDPRLNFFWWVAYAVIWGASLAFDAALGFRLNNEEATIAKDIIAALLGLTAGGLIFGINYLISFIDASFSYASPESVWLVMIAPVSETLLFDVGIYEVFDFYLRPADWTQVAIASDISFVGFHYWKYFTQTQLIAPILIIIILTVGNTLFIYIYHITKNATAPMVAHTVVNFTSARTQVIQAFIDAVPLISTLAVIVVIVYFLTKVCRR